MFKSENATDRAKLKLKWKPYNFLMGINLYIGLSGLVFVFAFLVVSNKRQNG